MEQKCLTFLSGIALLSALALGGGECARQQYVNRLASGVKASDTRWDHGNHQLPDGIGGTMNSSALGDGHESVGSDEETGTYDDWGRKVKIGVAHDVNATDLFQEELDQVKKRMGLIGLDIQVDANIHVDLYQNIDVRSLGKVVRATFYEPYDYHLVITDKDLKDPRYDYKALVYPQERVGIFDGNIERHSLDEWIYRSIRDIFTDDPMPASYVLDLEGLERTGHYEIKDNKGKRLREDFVDHSMTVPDTNRNVSMGVWYDGSDRAYLDDMLNTMNDHFTSMYDVSFAFEVIETDLSPSFNIIEHILANQEDYDGEKECYMVVTDKDYCNVSLPGSVEMTGFAESVGFMYSELKGDTAFDTQTMLHEAYHMFGASHVLDADFLMHPHCNGGPVATHPTTRDTILRNREIQWAFKGVDPQDTEERLEALTNRYQYQIAIKGAQSEKSKDMP